MFLCDKCLDKRNWQRLGICRSFGQCEDCHLTRSCHDI